MNLSRGGSRPGMLRLLPNRFPAAPRSHAPRTPPRRAARTPARARLVRVGAAARGEAGEACAIAEKQLRLKRPKPIEPAPARTTAFVAPGLSPFVSLRARVGDEHNSNMRPPGSSCAGPGHNQTRGDAMRPHQELSAKAP